MKLKQPGNVCDSTDTRTGEPCGNRTTRDRCPRRADHARIARERSARAASTTTGRRPSPDGRGLIVETVTHAYTLADLDPAARTAALAGIAEIDYELPDRISDQLDATLERRGVADVVTVTDFHVDPAAAGARVRVLLDGEYATDAHPTGAPGIDLPGTVTIDPDHGAAVEWADPGTHLTPAEERARAQFEETVTLWHAQLIADLTAAARTEWETSQQADRLAATAERDGLLFAADGTLLDL